MKILHTSDWHLGKKLDSFSRFEEQIAVLDEICLISEQENPDLILVAGDLFDTYNPQNEAVELLYKTLKRLTRDGKCPVIAIAGNHDSADRIEAPDPLARECGIVFSGYPNSVVKSFEISTEVAVTQSDEGFIELKIPQIPYPVRILNVPYANEFRLRTFLGNDDTEKELRILLANHWKSIADKYCDENGVNLMMAHLYFTGIPGSDIPIETEDEKPIAGVGGAPALFVRDIPEQIQYTALGHIHKYMNLNSGASPVVYCGSPLAYSFGDVASQKYVCVVDVEPGKQATYRKIPLQSGRKLLRQRFESTDSAVEWLQANPYSIVEITLALGTYPGSEDKKRILQAHDAVTAIIPEVNNEISENKTQTADLSKDITELFDLYFQQKFGSTPNEQIKALFKEVLSQNEEE